VPENESLKLLASHGSSMAIFLSTGMVDETVKELLHGGYPDTTPVAVVYRASWPDEKCIKGTLETIVDKVREAGITRQALILVGAAIDRPDFEPSKLYAPNFTHGYREKKIAEMNKTAIIALTRRGWHTGRKIVHSVDDATLFLPDRFRKEVHESRVCFFDNVANIVEKLFYEYQSLVLIMATGIAVRLVASLVKSKWEDPAIITMDDGGRNIISLLSGHWGGANDLTLKLSHILGGNPVITTESDVMGFPSVDTIIKLLTSGTVPKKKKLIKEIQSDILEGEDVGFYPKELMFLPAMQGHPNLHYFDSLEALVSSRCKTGVIVSHKLSHAENSSGKFLSVNPRDLVVGIGCHIGITAEEVGLGISEIFRQNDLSLASIAAVCSADRKKYEQGLIKYAESKKIPLNFFAADEINTINVPTPASKYSMKELGVHGIAEPCARLGADGGKLLVHKVKLSHMTVAVARIPIKQIIDSSRELCDG